MKTAIGKDQLLSQFQVILEGVSKTVEKVTCSCDFLEHPFAAKKKVQVQGDFEMEKATLDVKQTQYNKLVDEQRSYFKLVKMFQEECVKNEQMASLIQSDE